MKTLTIPVELLNLEDIEFLESVLTSDNGIIIRVKSTKKELPCHRCGEPCDQYGKGTTIKLSHLAILGRGSEIADFGFQLASFSPPLLSQHQCR